MHLHILLRAHVNTHWNKLIYIPQAQSNAVTNVNLGLNGFETFRKCCKNWDNLKYKPFFRSTKCQFGLTEAVFFILHSNVFRLWAITLFIRMINSRMFDIKSYFTSYLCKLYKKEFVYIKQMLTCTVFIWCIVQHIQKCGNVIMLNITCDLHLICVKCELPMSVLHFPFILNF